MDGAAGPRRVAVVTNALDYAGPGSVRALAAAGFRVVAHDAVFASEREARAFEDACPGVLACPEAAAPDVIDFALARFARLDAVVSNDVYPALAGRIDELDIDDFRESVEALLVQPAAFLKKAAGVLKARRAGSIVVVTSASFLQPEAGLAAYAAPRAGASVLARCLAREMAEFGVSVNVVAPNFLASDIYYPQETWGPGGRMEPQLRQQVPLGRLGSAEELGALVAFLAGGQAGFVTGQVIPFTGGWGP